ncbi:DNase/tRNase domain of colicin-like bacteriocin [Lentzea albidocapillata]|uniref:DNase/tRNase domain of colicin-like bacteriocin n=1 Tax=Lentzea albidocapillata TaxID=40571 RepID=A0A1W2FUC7_9PSEU|nr:hypothetical protein [Lentzea albidocapillata]SMD25226.1 DNase/tRNase domain of colicin-like bacteriocin [Lentzea albidocapillata]
MLEGRSFDSFDDFRKVFWMAVAADAYLVSQFDRRDKYRLAAGYAPAEDESQRHGGQSRYVLHHIQPIQHEGGVYDLNNIIVAPPEVPS